MVSPELCVAATATTRGENPRIRSHGARKAWERGMSFEPGGWNRSYSTRVILKCRKAVLTPDTGFPEKLF